MAPSRCPRGFVCLSIGLPDGRWMAGEGGSVPGPEYLVLQTTALAVTYLHFLCTCMRGFTRRKSSTNTRSQLKTWRPVYVSNKPPDMTCHLVCDSVASCVSSSVLPVCKWQCLWVSVDVHARVCSFARGDGGRGKINGKIYRERNFINPRRNYYETGKSPL